MALADIPTSGQARRLDSWKEIAEYLRKDVRTATRWESQGLPLHRVGGGKGRSVFAFTSEIDAWMASRPADLQAEAVSSPPPQASSHRFRTVAVSIACAVGVVAVGAVVMSSPRAALLDLASLAVNATTTHVSIADASGTSRVIHLLKPGAVLLRGASVRVEDLDSDGTPEILAAVAYYDTQAGRYNSGELLDLLPAGDVRWRFAFNDALTFPGGNVSGPWMISDWQAEPDASLKRVAIAAHEDRWWASIVAVLDSGGRRLSTFVNPGWIESVLWLSSDRLAVGGFNNKRDEGMFAMLDANRIDGQAPGVAETVYSCVSCPTAGPMFYATFARSELNRVTAGRFNRARISAKGGRVEVTTVEIARENGDATALYEFDRDLRLLRARYSDTYWDEHVRLEREGRLSHPRESCPERDGPAAIHIWDATRGWVKTAALSGQ